MNSASATMNIRLQRQKGTSMIEVLVTVVIVAIALLGIAALQFMSKRSNLDAVQRTTASLLASDIIERMRYNPKALKTYAGSLENPNPTLGYGSTAFSGAPSPDCSPSNPCNTDQLAAHDLWVWQQRLLGAGEVSGSSNTGGLTYPTACVMTNVSDSVTNRSGRYTVAIAWRGQTELSDPTNPVTASYDPYACGRDNGAVNTGLYDGPAPSTKKNGYRRILIVDTYIPQY